MFKQTMSSQSRQDRFRFITGKCLQLLLDNFKWRLAEIKSLDQLATGYPFVNDSIRDLKALRSTLGRLPTLSDLRAHWSKQN